MEKDTQRDESEQDTQTDESSGADFEKRYKDATAWGTKVSQENKALKSQLDEMKGQLSVLMQALQKEKEPEQEAPKSLFEGVDASEWIDNPDSLKNVLASLDGKVANTEKTLVEKIVKLLEERDRAYDEKISGISPENLKKKAMIEQYKEEIDRLKEEEEFSEMDDYHLAVIASKLSPKENAHILIPHVGGRRTSGVSNAGKKKEDAEVDALLQKMGYTKENGYK